MKDTSSKRSRDRMDAGTRRRAQSLLLVILIIIAALLGPFYWTWLSVRRVVRESMHQGRAVFHVKRWGSFEGLRHGRYLEYWRDDRTPKEESFFRNGAPRGIQTLWNEEGQTIRQSRFDEQGDVVEMRDSPPWLDPRLATPPDEKGRR